MMEPLEEPPPELGLPTFAPPDRGASRDMQEQVGGSLCNNAQVNAQVDAGCTNDIGCRSMVGDETVTARLETSNASCSEGTVPGGQPEAGGASCSRSVVDASTAADVAPGTVAIGGHPEAGGANCNGGADALTTADVAREDTRHAPSVVSQPSQKSKDKGREGKPPKPRRSRLKEHETGEDEGSSSDSGSEDDEHGGPVHDQTHDAWGPNSQEIAVERSPLARFVRFNRKLGSGSHKTVYLGFDNDTGKEVAWNVISLQDMDKRAKKRITEEINMLKSLKHVRIIAFINAWINKKDNQVCFITERVTGGSLLSYIRRIGAPLKLKVMRTWCRQILEGIHFLHTRNPSIIHRDLKCDNIFINGHVGEVLIGDLGLSTSLNKSFAASIVGTPDFIAPEIYEEKYGTAVDIYAFGMCLLEMVSRGSPYEECSTPGQVYKKVIAGEKPRVLRRIKDEQLRTIIDQCIGKDPYLRPTAEDLLEHRWLAENEADGNQLCELSPVEHVMHLEGIVEGDENTRDEERQQEARNREEVHAAPDNLESRTNSSNVILSTATSSFTPGAIGSTGTATATASTPSAVSGINSAMVSNAGSTMISNAGSTMVSSTGAQISASSTTVSNTGVQMSAGMADAAELGRKLAATSLGDPATTPAAPPLVVPPQSVVPAGTQADNVTGVQRTGSMQGAPSSVQVAAPVASAQSMHTAPSTVQVPLPAPVQNVATAAPPGNVPGIAADGTIRPQNSVSISQAPMNQISPRLEGARASGRPRAVTMPAMMHEAAADAVACMQGAPGIAPAVVAPAAPSSACPDTSAPGFTTTAQPLGIPRNLTDGSASPKVVQGTAQAAIPTAMVHPTATSVGVPSMVAAADTPLAQKFVSGSAAENNVGAQQALSAASMGSIPPAAAPVNLSTASSPPPIPQGIPGDSDFAAQNAPGIVQPTVSRTVVTARDDLLQLSNSGVQAESSPSSHSASSRAQPATMAPAIPQIVMTPASGTAGPAITMTTPASNSSAAMMGVQVDGANNMQGAPAAMHVAANSLPAVETIDTGNDSGAHRNHMHKTELPYESRQELDDVGTLPMVSNPVHSVTHASPPAEVRTEPEAAATLPTAVAVVPIETRAASAEMDKYVAEANNLSGMQITNSPKLRVAGPIAQPEDVHEPVELPDAHQVEDKSKILPVEMNPFTDGIGEVRHAMDSIGQTVVTGVTVDIQQTHCKFNVSFDFNAETDTVIGVAEELRDELNVAREISFEDLMRKIERAIIARCYNIARQEKIAAQAVVPQENQNHSRMEETAPPTAVGGILPQDATEPALVQSAHVAPAEQVEDVRVEEHPTPAVDLVEQCMNPVVQVQIEPGSNTQVALTRNDSNDIPHARISAPEFHGEYLTPQAPAPEYTPEDLPPNVLPPEQTTEVVETGWGSLGWSSTSPKHPELTGDLLKSDDSTIKEHVTLLQRSLAYLIPSVQEDDFKQIGEWCDATAKAVSSFQQYHSLSNERGAVADDKFWEVLEDAVKKKDTKEIEKKAKREEDRKKSQQVREQRKQLQDLESALQLQSLEQEIRTGICAMGPSAQEPAGGANKAAPPAPTAAQATRSGTLSAQGLTQMSAGHGSLAAPALAVPAAQGLQPSLTSQQTQQSVPAPGIPQHTAQQPFANPTNAPTPPAISRPSSPRSLQSSNPIPPIAPTPVAPHPSQQANMQHHSGGMMVPLANAMPQPQQGHIPEPEVGKIPAAPVTAPPTAATSPAHPFQSVQTHPQNLGPAIAAVNQPASTMTQHQSTQSGQTAVGLQYTAQPTTTGMPMPGPPLTTGALDRVQSNSSLSALSMQSSTQSGPLAPTPPVATTATAPVAWPATQGLPQKLEDELL